MSSLTSDGANQDTSSSNSSPATENKKKRKAKESAPSDETRRNNHKLIEQRRRKKINDKLEDLRQILSALDSQNPNSNANPSPGSLQGNDHPNKSSILDNTIVAIRHLQQVATKLAIQHRQLQYESVHLRKVLAKASRPPASRPSPKPMMDGFNSPPNFDFARLSSNPGMPPPSALPNQLQEAQIRLAMYQHQQNQQQQQQQQQQRYLRQDPREQQSSFPPYLLNSSIPTPTSSSSSNSSSNSSSSASSTESTPRSSVSSLADVAMQHKLWELLRRQQQDMQQQRANSAPSIDNLPNNNNTNASNTSQEQGSPPF